MSGSGSEGVVGVSVGVGVRSGGKSVCQGVEVSVVWEWCGEKVQSRVWEWMEIRMVCSAMWCK